MQSKRNPREAQKSSVTPLQRPENRGEFDRALRQASTSFFSTRLYKKTPFCLVLWSYSIKTRPKFYFHTSLLLILNLNCKAYLTHSNSSKNPISLTPTFSVFHQAKVCSQRTVPKTSALCNGLILTSTDYAKGESEAAFNSPTSAVSFGDTSALEHTQEMRGEPL